MKTRSWVWIVMPRREVYTLSLTEKERGQSLWGRGPLATGQILNTEDSTARVRWGSLREASDSWGRWKPRSEELWHLCITLFKTHITFLLFLKDNVRVGGILRKAVMLKKGIRTSGGLRYIPLMYQLICILHPIHIFLYMHTFNS